MYLHRRHCAVVCSRPSPLVRIILSPFLPSFSFSSDLYHVRNPLSFFLLWLTYLHPWHYAVLSFVTQSHSHLATTPEEQATFEATIVDACTKHKQAHWKDYNYRACVFIGTDYFVKFGDPQTLWPEVATQSYISEYAQSHPDMPRMPRIPKVIHHFRDQQTMYLVMEYITLTAPSPDLTERTAEALKWLSGVPAPPDHVFGPLGGGRIRHRFFKDNEAPLSFSSIGALEHYMEKGYTMLSSLAKQRVPSIKICGERLMFMQPDMHPSNFGVDEHGNTVLMDFGEFQSLDGRNLLLFVDDVRPETWPERGRLSQDEGQQTLDEGDRLRCMSTRDPQAQP
ncbi:hypothetical protein AX16_002126, partial [Volvariella volvacea WC 439]